MARRVLVALAALLVAFAAANRASAAGGHYVFDGGTAAERAQVTEALDASSFDWSLVTQQVTIHIVRGIPSSEAAPGQIWLDADLLDAGQFSWGVVQHEYAHEVDYALFDSATRAQLLQRLGGAVWFDDGTSSLPHADYGCERFASTLAWAYWQSPANVMKPTSPTDESAALPPVQFRALVAQLLAAR